MDLFIIRHAQAGHVGDSNWPDDAQRPLTDEGRLRFARVVDRLVEREFSVGIIATSPLVRAVETAEVLSERLANHPPVVELEALAPGSDVGALLAWSTEQTARYRQVAWVGHSPDVDRMAAALIGAAADSIRFAKSSIAFIRFHGTPELGLGKLRWLLTAQMLGC